MKHRTNRIPRVVPTRPALLDMAKAQPVAIVRAWGGGCGPNADKHCAKVVS